MKAKWAIVAMLLAAVVAMAFNNVGIGATVIGFDDRPGERPKSDVGDPVELSFLVNDEYASLGVFFDSGGGGIVVSAPSNPVSPPNSASATGPGPVTGIGLYPVFAWFSVGGIDALVDSVSVDLSNSSRTSTLSAFDLYGNFLDSDTGGQSAHLTVAAPGAIHEIRITGIMAFDNFTFDGLKPIPEPWTLSLLALGGLAVIRRRRGR